MIDLKAQTKDGDAQLSVEHRFRQGSDAAFDEVMDQYSAMMRRLVQRLLAWDADVEDVVQDVFVKAYLHRFRFRADASLKTWLYSIAINICRTRNRRRLFWQKFRLQHSHRRSVYDEDPRRAVLDRETAARVRRAVGQLPVKYRDVIVLKYLEELPTEEILKILNVNEKAFYTRLSRARGQMQTLLSDYLDHEDE